MGGRMSQYARHLTDQLVATFNDPDPAATDRFGDLLNEGYDAQLSHEEWDEIDQRLRSQPGWNSGCAGACESEL
jgi:hypothetical protein